MNVRIGTFRTWRDVRVASAFGGIAEVGFRSVGSAFDPISDIGQNLTLHWVLTAYLPDGVLKIVARREREDKAA
jgi:hypothetical protein